MAGRQASGRAFSFRRGLLLTNHHVLPNAAVARTSLIEFDYQLGLNGAFQPTTTFSLEPNVFFFANQHFDYALVAVQRTSGAGARQLAELWLECPYRGGRQSHHLSVAEHHSASQWRGKTTRTSRESTGRCAG